MANDDQRGAWVATISAVTVIASFVASKAARDAILLARFDVTRLPVFITISAVTSLPIILVAGRLMVRWGPARLIPVLNIASAALAIGEWLLIGRAPRAIAVVVFFHLATLGGVLVSGFWSMVNERFDVQSAKRHIARIGIGATLGGIFGGVIAERAAVYLAPDAILLVLAGLQLACAVTLRLFGRAERREPVAAAPDEPWLALRAATRTPLLRVLGGLVILGAIAAAVMDYVFKADIVRGASHDGVLRSLAIFYTVTSVITAVVQIAVCGPLIARLGVARSVATLPTAVTVFGIAAIAMPVPLVAAIARGAEAVTRNSVYRAGYELIYAPLVEDHKRPAKLVLDVGADRIGDVLGAQLVGLLVYALADPRTGLLIATVCVGAAAVVLAIRLPRSYTMALEESLLARAAEPAAAPSAADDEPRPWITLDGVPGLGQSGEFPALSIRTRRSAPPRRMRPSPPPRARRRTAPGRDPALEAIADLRSGDAGRIQRALSGGLTPDLASYAVDLLGRDDVAHAAITALGGVAPHCTGMLVDALLDRRRDIAVRRRLPAVLVSGEPAHASWGLWRALGDPSFDVRYRSGAVLARLAADGHLRGVSADDVFDAVRRELLAGRDALAGPQVLDELAAAIEEDRAGADPPVHRGSAGLEHVFTVLGLALPAEPLRIALHAVQTDDPELRGTAMEYLESILPPDVRAQLWPLLEGDLAPPPAAPTAGPTAELPLAAALIAPAPLAAPRPPRSHDEILDALRLSYPRVLDRLRQRPRPA